MHPPIKAFFMNKKILLLAAAAAIISTSCQQNKNIQISGSITNTTTPLLFADEVVSDFTDTIAVKNGTFSFPVKLDHPGFRYIIAGKSSRELFLKPGMSLQISVNPTTVPDSFSFKIEGKGAAETNAIDSLEKRILKMNGHYVFKIPPAKGTAYIDSAFEGYGIYLDQLNATTPLDPDFMKFEKIALDYDAAGFKMQNAIQQDIKDPGYFLFVKKLDIENESYMDIPDFRAFLSAYFHQQANAISREDATDEEYLDTLLSMIQKTKNKTIREYFLFNKLNMNIGADLVTSTEKYKNYFAKNNTNPVYATAIAKAFAEKEMLAVGTNAPDFTLVDKNEHTVSLKDLTGKLVYIDFWATWCHPCLEQRPFFEKLKEEYKDKNIVFLSISVDDEKNKWLAFLDKNKAETNEYHAVKGMKSEIATAYQVKAIPLFVLIDKDGKLINQSAEEPSSKEIRGVLDKLLN